VAHRSYYGVFDGHGGYLASQYCVDRLSLYIKDEPEFPDGDIGAAMHDSYMKIDDDFIASGKPDGTTVCTCIVVGGKKVYCANTGDSRAIVVRRNGSVVEMSKDHKPGDPDETKRITDLGGTVVYWGRWRVESVLAVSRAVGDAQVGSGRSELPTIVLYDEQRTGGAKRRPYTTTAQQLTPFYLSQLMPYITAKPDIVERDLDDDDLFLVIGTDGIWDVLENERVGKFVIDNVIDTGTDGSGGKVDEELLRWIGRKLCVEAGDCGSGDNVSAVVVDLKG